jgi:hypothetical protein
VKQARAKTAAGEKDVQQILSHLFCMLLPLLLPLGKTTIMVVRRRGAKLVWLEDSGVSFVKNPHLGPQDDGQGGHERGILSFGFVGVTPVKDLAGLDRIIIRSH